MSENGSASGAFGSASADKNAGLFEAVTQSDANIVWKALLGGADINCTDDDNNTPLIRAACNSTVEVVQALLQAGADPLRRNTKGETALMATLPIFHDIRDRFEAGQSTDIPGDAKRCYNLGLIGGALFKAEKEATERNVAECNAGVQEKVTVRSSPLKFKNPAS